MGQKGSAAMLTTTQLAGVTPEVNLRITQVRKHTRDLPWFLEILGKHHQKSKIGVSVAPQKGPVSSKN